MKLEENTIHFYLPLWYGVNPDNGRPMWVDSATGKPTEDYNLAKKVIAGKTQPDGIMSFSNTFSYKGFELLARLYYQYGSQLYFNAGAEYINDGVWPLNNQIESALNRWSKPGQTAANPRRLIGGIAPIPGGGYENDNGGMGSTRYIYDGDFLRLAMLSLAYNLPTTLISKIRMTSCRVVYTGK